MGMGSLVGPGFSYKGLFEYGTFHGKGHLQDFNRGISYQGEFADNSKHGLGILLDE